MYIVHMYTTGFRLIVLSLLHLNRARALHLGGGRLDDVHKLGLEGGAAHQEAVNVLLSDQAGRIGGLQHAEESTGDKWRFSWMRENMS